MSINRNFTPFIDRMPPACKKFIVASDENINKPRDTIFRSASREVGSELIKLVRDNGCYNYKYIHNLYWKIIDFKMTG